MRGLPDTLSPETSRPHPVASGPRALSGGLWLAAGGALAAAFAVGLLWATQGGAVFYELATAGFSACF